VERKRKSGQARLADRETRQSLKVLVVVPEIAGEADKLRHRAPVLWYLFVNPSEAGHWEVMQRLGCQPLVVRRGVLLWKCGFPWSRTAFALDTM